MSTFAARDDSVAGSVPGQGVGLRLREVEKVFAGGVRALDPIDLEISAGEFVSVLGPSGCGKSTLLRIVAGLEKASAGSVEIKGGQGNARRSVAFVFQDAHLLPWRTVLQNVALPLELMGLSSAERERAVREVIRQVGLEDAMDRYPAQLSGGMRMRVSLARALVTEPALLLMDEPFAALDEITRQRLDDQLRELWARRGMTVIFVTHSIVEGVLLAERAVVMSKRPGKVVLDHRLALPAERRAELRTDPGFAREMGVLFRALEMGEKR